MIPYKFVSLLISVQQADGIYGGNALHVNYIMLLKGNTL